MNPVTDFRRPDLARGLLDTVQRQAARLAGRLGRRVVLMEVCGTHTVAISRSGMRAALASCLELKSGPGCPVCVTDYADIDAMIALARLPEVTVATFGDMLRVPGSHGSLEEERARGARVQVFYSPLDTVAWAAVHPERQVVFLGVGFETTAPGVALALEAARQRGLPNFSLFSSHKLVPPVMRALVEDPHLAVDGFILPGHVSVITGRQAFDFLAAEYGKPAAVAGFEPVDILAAVGELLKQLASGRAAVANTYTRVVREDGNPVAREVLGRYFEPDAASWRGIGNVPASGLALRPEYGAWDARRRFPVEVPPPRIPPGCRCGELLKGYIIPPDCRLFGRACTPEHPVGPCMVSSEGACAAYYQWEMRSETPASNEFQPLF